MIAPTTPALRPHEDVIRALEPEVERQLRTLRPIDTAWQPTDCLPDLVQEGWPERLAEFRDAARAVPDDLLVVLVGDMVTEEALPSYSTALNQLVGDAEGTSPAPWARWLRGWTAEENRHGDVLNAWLRLSGRVDMRAIERTVHALLAGGFNSRSGTDPYNLLVYTSFQERATRVAHAGVARRAEQAGERRLARICRAIAGEEARHERFYTAMMAHVLDVDPEGGVLAFAAMLERQIAMPGRAMTDGREPGLFDRFALVAERTGVYTAADYAAIVEHLVCAWRIGDRRLSGEAARAQDHLCALGARYGRLAERAAEAAARRPPVKFSWIFDRVA
ncbi:MAG: acyl-ACP desaturase [Acidimicrobiia bacterium]|nr:acyl-ACP desaturase [Acidimicrobiia bacterium]